MISDDPIISPIGNGESDDPFLAFFINSFRYSFWTPFFGEFVVIIVNFINTCLYFINIKLMTHMAIMTYFFYLIIFIWSLALWEAIHAMIDNFSSLVCFNMQYCHFRAIMKNKSSSRSSYKCFSIFCILFWVAINSEVDGSEMFNWLIVWENANISTRTETA